MLRTRSPRKEKISNCYLHSNSLSNKMDNSLLAVRDINHKYIVVERIVSRSLLMEKLWESDAYVDENTLSVNVNRLRKKLDSIGLESFIVTKKGLGYRLG